ncbi:MAG: hypothetical protein WD075_11190 [Rhodospirillales bacterium]
MQMSAAIFTDPTMRPQLEQYYENKKTAAIDALERVAFNWSHTLRL